MKRAIVTIFYTDGKVLCFKGVERFKLTLTFISLTTEEFPGRWTYINTYQVDTFEVEPE